MESFTDEERLAVLLNLLGEEPAEVAFRTMNPTRANYVRQLLEDFKTDPPQPHEINYVLDDFEKYFRFALDTVTDDSEVADQSPAASVSRGAADGAAAQSAVGSKKGSVVHFPEIEISGDPAQDLNRLDPYQIATALSNDHPKTIALVLNQIDSGQAARVIEQLPADIRSQIILLVSQPSSVPKQIVQRVLETTVEKSSSVKFREETCDQTDVVVAMMRSLPKKLRREMMEQIQQEDEELAQKIQSKLYIFEDLKKLDDRSIQKVLSEVESDNLIVALQEAEQEIIDKLLNNLSKRARETIQEEMQYKSGVDESEIATARDAIVERIAKLDEEGEISL